MVPRGHGSSHSTGGAAPYVRRLVTVCPMFSTVLNFPFVVVGGQGLHACCAQLPYPWGVYVSCGEWSRINSADTRETCPNQ